MSNTPQNQTFPDTTESKDFIRYDDYWLQKARTFIDGSLNIFVNRLNTLNSFLNYLATGTFLGGVTYSTYLQSDKFWVFFSFALPLVFIGIAKYSVSVGAGKIEMRETDMRSPTQINDSYNRVLLRIAENVRQSSVWVGTATFFALVCFPAATYFHNLENGKDVPETYFSVTSDSNNLYLKGSLGEVKNVIGIFYGRDSKNKAKNPTYVDFLLQKSGELIATVNLNHLDIQLDSIELNYISQKQQSSHKYIFSGIKSKNIKTSQTNQSTNAAKDSI